MSYDVSLENAGLVERFCEGGTYAIGGSDEPELNITYNYAEVYKLLNFSIRQLDGQKAAVMIPAMELVVNVLGTKKYEKDYWAPTPGNAGHALNILLGWAKQYPEAVFRVS